MRERAELVIVGAGIVGCSAAYFLSQKGWKNIVVIEQGPLFEPGGSTSHAPGLVFELNTSKTMCQLARWSVDLYSQLELDQLPCFLPVGSIEVAYTQERLDDLKLKLGRAFSWGLKAELLEPQDVKDKLPLINIDRVLGALHVPEDGIAKATRACESMARSASGNGTEFIGDTEVLDIEIENGRVQAVVTSNGRVATNKVLVCAGIWGPRIGRMAGVPIPLVPVQHQYVKTDPLKELEGELEEARHPIVRHQDRSMYFRQHGDCYGIGSYQHEPLLVDPDAIARHKLDASLVDSDENADAGKRHDDAGGTPAPPGLKVDRSPAGHDRSTVGHDRSTVGHGRNPVAQHDSPLMPSVRSFTPEHFEQAHNDAVELFPCLKNVELPYRINGMFSFTPDGNPVLGESLDVRGFWVAEAVWVTHGGGVGKVAAELLNGEIPELDLRELNMHRFHPHATTRAYVNARGAQQYREVYDIIHPLQQMESPRPLRTTPFYSQHRDLGATFFESAGWERPQWFSSNDHLPGELDWPERTGWTARFWSDTIGREHKATREGVAMFDLTPFTKLEVTGLKKDALPYMQKLTANQMDHPPGRVTYTPMLNQQGGIVCDLTVTRLSDPNDADRDRFLVLTGGGSGILDKAWMESHLPDDGSVHLTDVTSGLCCIGLWGPLARDLLKSVCDNDLGNEAFPPYTAQSIYIGAVPALAVRISYVGELGWEIYTRTEYGAGLWDMLFQAGRPFGVIAAGGGAFESLRLEKGYRLWGAEVHTEYNPYEAGLGFAVRLNKGEFIGKEKLKEFKKRGPERRLCCCTIDDRKTVVMGKEPIFSSDGNTVLGYVTSASYGYTVEESIFYGYLPIEYSSPGTSVEVMFFGNRHQATVRQEPLYDPENHKVRAELPKSLSSSDEAKHVLAGSKTR